MSSSSDNICVTCGFCCDNTLYDINNAGHEYIQPCMFHCGSCTIYETRPKPCIDFRCKLLREVESGDKTEDEALSIINKAKVGIAELCDRPFRKMLIDVVKHNKPNKTKILFLGIYIEENFKYPKNEIGSITHET